MCIDLLWNMMLESMMFRRILINYGWLKAEVYFWGINPLQISSFVRSVKANQYVAPETEVRLHSPLHFQFDRLAWVASIASGNRGCRMSMREGMHLYDGIAYFIDETNDEALRYSKEELKSLLSDDSISNPIVILVPTQSASGSVNDPELISEYELDDVIRKRNGRVSVFAYSISPTQFIGCLEGRRELILWN